MRFIEKFFKILSILILVATVLFIFVIPTGKYEDENTVILFNNFTQKYFAMEYQLKETDSTYHIISKSTGYYHKISSDYTKAYRVINQKRIEESKIYSFSDKYGKFDYWQCLIAFFNKNTITV